MTARERLLARRHGRGAWSSADEREVLRRCDTRDPQIWRLSRNAAGNLNHWLRPSIGPPALSGARAGSE